MFGKAPLMSGEAMMRSTGSMSAMVSWRKMASCGDWPGMAPQRLAGMWGSRWGRMWRRRMVQTILTSVTAEAGSDPRGHLWGTWGVYLCAGKPPLADIILYHPPDLTRCDSVIGLAIPAMSGHIQYRGAASPDLYIRISGINRVFLS